MLTSINTCRNLDILIGEDEFDIALLYKIALEKRNHTVSIADNGEDCLKKYHEKFQRLRFNRLYSTSGDILPFDIVILDHKMPKIDGVRVAQEILAVNPHQRIIFASAYVRETLLDSVKGLNQFVEIMEKPFGVNALMDTIEDNTIYSELGRFNVDLDVIKALSPSHEQITDLLERLRKLRQPR
jgi:DNA-binding response OmpR family regulator